MIVTGLYQSEQRGFTYIGGNSYQADSDGEIVSHAELVSAAQADNNEALTWTVVHEHVAERLGIDRNANGLLNRDDFLDSDNDGVADEIDLFPEDPSESADFDADGIGNNADNDDDNDGVLDVDDQLPFNAAEALDSDADGIGNNADNDDDGDGVSDAEDAFPLNFDETADTDGDGIGNSADIDDDNDGISDTEESSADPEVRILAGRTGGEYNISNGSQLSPMREALLDSDNFSPAGIVSVESLSILEDAPVITASSLQDVDILFDGWSQSTDWDSAELSVIDTWVRAGGILISTNDAADRDALSTLFGVPAIARSGTTWVPANAVHPVVNGPFGTWSSVGTVGLFSYFNPMDDWNTIASDTNGRATIIERTVGQGHVIITGDEGVLMRNTSANNRGMSLNLFAYAIDMLPKLAGDVDEDRLENQLDLDSDNDGIPDVIEAGGIDANNDGMIDDPFNNQGTLSSLPDSDNDGLFDFLDADDNPSIGGNSEDQYPDGVYNPADDTRYFSYSVNGLHSVEINPLLSEALPTIGELLSGRKDVFDNAHPLGIEVSGNTTTTSGNTQSASTQSKSSSGALGFGWLVAGLSMLGYQRACKKTVTRM